MSSLAKHALVKTVTVRLRRQPNSNEFAVYLNGELNITGSALGTSLWPRIRASTTRLKLKLEVRWAWSPQAEQLELHLSNNTVVKAQTRRILYRWLWQ